MGRFARGKGARSYEARFSPSRSPFPGTSLFCAVVWGSVLVNACMLLYWWRQAEPIFLFRRTEGGLRSRPVPGGCCIAGANLLLPVVLLLALISAPACCIAGADLLLPVVLLPALTCSCLSLYCRRSLAPVCCRITGIDLLLPVAVLPALTCSRLLSHHWHKPTSACRCIAGAHLPPSSVYCRITGINPLPLTTGNRPAARAAFPSDETKIGSA